MLIVCPGCNTNYSIDERSISAGRARLLCRECGTETIVAAQDEAAPATATAGAAAAADAASKAADTSHQISCPSCGHRFAPSADAPKKQSPARAQSRLLLVEDQAYFIQLTKDALGPDFDVTAVSEIPGAERALEQDRFDLVILDLSLQGNQDGRGLLQSIRKRCIPVLIFTARDESEFYGEVWDELKAAGATDIILKGVNVGEELKRKVVAIVGSRPAQ